MSRNSEVRIGILGSGWMGSVHSERYQQIRGAKVVGVFSRNRERAEVVAKIWGATAVSDAAALLDEPAIDAIDVCVPTANHREFVLAALARGKHVFCETPLALQLADAEAMVAAAKKSNRLLLVGLLTRSIAQYQHVHQVAVSGRLGTMLNLTAYRLSSYLRAEDHHRYSDPTTELMTFDFDFVHWLMGPPAAISATAVSTESGDPGEVSALLQFDSGKSATVLASGIMPKSFPFSVGFRALFEKGAFELKTVFEGDGPPKNTFHFYSDNGRPETIAIAEHDPYEHELQHFVDCIRGEAESESLQAEHAVEALKLSIVTRQALATGTCSLKQEVR